MSAADNLSAQQFPQRAPRPGDLNYKPVRIGGDQSIPLTGRWATDDSHDPDVNPRGRTPGDDGWNTPPSPAKRAFALTEKKKGYT